jgi:uncharacterized protein
MSNEKVIDSISFAKKSESLQGKIPVDSLGRLRSSLAESDGEIEFLLKGKLDSSRRPSLVLSVRGSVMVRCQRCLTAFEHELNIDSQLVLVTSEAQLPELGEEDPDVDVVVAAEKMNVLDLVEDEIILSLPLALRHDFECVAVEAADVMEALRRPFAGLGKPS